MKFYRLTFLKNDVISCIEAIDIVNDLPFYEQDNGQLIFALVRAETEEEARVTGVSIAEDVRKCHERKENGASF